MDRNSITGLTLIAALLLLYFFVFAPTSSPVQTPPPVVESQRQADSVRSPSAKSGDTTQVQDYAQAGGELKMTTVENEDLALAFSNDGTLHHVVLKKFKTYTNQPLVLVDPSTNKFALDARLAGRDIDLYQLRYELAMGRTGDTTTLQYSAQLDGGSMIRHTYKIPASGYLIGYSLETKGISLEGDYLTLRWRDNIPLQEKDLADSRQKTTVNYYTLAGDFDGISESSLDPEREAIADPVKWVAIRQKFFINSIIASNRFSGGEISTEVNSLDSLHVKDATLKVFIPKEDALTGKSNFVYFFGPNDYSLLTGITPGFSRNLYLGWPPVIWVNKYLIIPIFNFLENYIGNYGIIIIILVLIIKILLTPLSYKSYLGMAKMKLLKPELDLIKEKNGDNMTQTQQDQLKLYQQAGVNPFSGCIPLLLQMPILFAMFYFFPVSIQLRQARFLWAEDLSTYDSILDLPFTIPFYGDHVSLFVLLMTASTLIYQWQNNQLSSVQGPMKSMSYMMPVIFMFLLNNFSAGLSFYYFVTNLVTFAQQAIIRRFVDETKIKAVMDDHKKKMAAGDGTGKKSRFMAKLEEAMKASEEARKKSGKK